MVRQDKILVRSLCTLVTASLLWQSGPVIASGNTMQDWGGSRTKGPAAMAYFKLPFHATKQKDNPSYGFALLGPSLQSTGRSTFVPLHAPKLVDLRFNGPQPSSLHIGRHLAWTNTSVHGSDGWHNADDDDKGSDIPSSMMWNTLGLVGLVGLTVLAVVYHDHCQTNPSGEKCARQQQKRIAKNN